MEPLVPEKKLAEGKEKVVVTTGRDSVVRIRFKKDPLDWSVPFRVAQTCDIFTLLRFRGVKNHFVDEYDNMSFRALNCKMIPLEVVVRRTAPPQSSYLKRNTRVKKGTIFCDLIVEFFYKDDKQNDPFVYIGADDETWLLFDKTKPVTERGEIGSIPALLPEVDVARIKNMARKSFLILEEAFARVGVTLHDLKEEYGRVISGCDAGTIVLADTITGDEMRLAEHGTILDVDVFRASVDMATIEKKHFRIAKFTEIFLDFLEEDVSV